MSVALLPKRGYMSTRCATEHSGPRLGSSLVTVQPAVTHVWLSMWGVRMALVLTEFLPKPSGRWGLRRSVSSPGLRGREGHRTDPPTGALTRSALPSSLGKECPRRDPLPPKVYHWPEQVSWPRLASQGREGPRCRACARAEGRSSVRGLGTTSPDAPGRPCSSCYPVSVASSDTRLQHS